MRATWGETLGTEGEREAERPRNGEVRRGDGRCGGMERRGGMQSLGCCKGLVPSQVGGTGEF